MQFDQLELLIKKVSADMQQMELQIRLQNPDYQRLFGYYTRLVEEYKERKPLEGEKENEELRKEDKSSSE